MDVYGGKDDEEKENKLVISVKKNQSIEDAFKQIQKVKLDLYGNTATSSNDLEKFLSENKSITHLILGPHHTSGNINLDNILNIGSIELLNCGNVNVSVSALINYGSVFTALNLDMNTLGSSLDWPALLKPCTNLYVLRSNINIMGGLEAILPKSKIHTLSLAGSSLGINDIKTLMGLLKNNETVTNLDIAMNQLGDKGMQLICDGLDKTKVHNLNVSSNSISDVSGSNIALLIKSNQTLKDIDLKSNAIDQSGFEKIMFGLQVSEFR
jgi:Ran GTPase-activating protein (RanGAP) involved in mRNA processing and transport